MTENSMRRPITMKITGTIFDSGRGEENLQLITEGDLYRK